MQSLVADSWVDSSLLEFPLFIVVSSLRQTRTADLYIISVAL